MGFQLTARDRSRLRGVHPDLVDVIELAAATSPLRFMVLEGIRTVERQKQLVARGASTTMNSRHIPAGNGYGHAVDIAPLGDDGQVSWDWPLYHRLAPAVKRAAHDLGTPIEWGGDWRSFKDGPHWQLPWAQYPGSAREVASAEPISEKTEGRVQAERAAVGAGGLTTASAVAGEPIADVVDVITGQQHELGSGDVVRMLIAAAIVGVTLWLVLRRARA